MNSTTASKRLNGEFSNLIRSGLFSAENGIQQYSIQPADDNTWSIECCAWCGREGLAGAVLDDGSEVLFEIHDGAIELTMPHECAAKQLADGPQNLGEAFDQRWEAHERFEASGSEKDHAAWLRAEKNLQEWLERDLDESERGAQE